MSRPLIEVGSLQRTRMRATLHGFVSKVKFCGIEVTPDFWGGGGGGGDWHMCIMYVWVVTSRRTQGIVHHV